MEDLELFGIPSTVVGGREWRELEEKEFSIGPDALLDELLEKRKWTNTEIAWVLKRMIYFYCKIDALLLKAQPERIFMNLVDVLRISYLILDLTNPELDENISSYISSKLADATWGINNRTRDYLHKF